MEDMQECVNLANVPVLPMTRSFLIRVSDLVKTYEMNLDDHG